MISIDPGSPDPPFAQVRDQVMALRAEGEFGVGHRLPTVRQLAAELGIAANTVARAYRELERRGAIETRGRHGSFIVGSGDSVKKEARAAAARYLTEIAALGLDADDATKALRKTIKAQRAAAPVPD